MISIACSLVFATCPSVCFARPPASNVSLDGPTAQAEFSQKASNGYSILFEINRGKANLTVQGDEGRASYSGIGSLMNGNIRFNLGEFGRINVRFKPDGSMNRIRPPDSCKGREQVVRSGAFVGSIKFRGENGYTQLNTRRVHGTMAPPLSWKCPNIFNRHPKSTANLPTILGAFTPHDRVSFVAIDGADLFPMGFFIAGTLERQGALSIKRSALTEGKPASFSASEDLSSATVSPPSPFTGTASFKRNTNGSAEWFGTLSVALPGIESVALTGSAFSANLAKPRTVQEVSELLGLS